jgi:hypothetical protein
MAVSLCPWPFNDLGCQTTRPNQQYWDFMVSVIRVQLDCCVLVSSSMFTLKQKSLRLVSWFQFFLAFTVNRRVYLQNSSNRNSILNLLFFKSSTFFFKTSLYGVFHRSWRRTWAWERGRTHSWSRRDWSSCGGLGRLGHGHVPRNHMKS